MVPWVSALLPRLRRGPLLLAARARGLSWHPTRHLAALPSDFNVLPGDDVTPGRRPAVIEAYDDSGFTIGGLDYPGPVICIGKQLALLWGAVQTAQDITPDSLAVFELVSPRPELLLVGTGRAVAGHALPRETREYLSGLGIKVDVQSTRHAAATHNFLGEEGRSVATALLLPGAVHP